MHKRAKPELVLGLKPKEMNFVIEYTKDFSARRAAEASGYAADTGYMLKEKEHIQAAIDLVLLQRLEASHVDAEWVLMEAVDNHMLARQQGNITASNTALNLIAKHTLVDALASDKLNMNIHGDKAVMERLLRGRKRAKEAESTDDEGSEVSFL